MSIIHTKVTLANGTEIACEYSLHCIPGNYTGKPEDCYPDDWEVGAPVFWVDDKQMELDDMPQNIAQAAMRLYMESPDEFQYTERAERDFTPDHEPDYEF